MEWLDLNLDCLSGWKGPVNLGLPIHLSRSFLGIGPLMFFLKLGIVLGAHVGLHMREPEVLGKNQPKLLKLIQKWDFVTFL